MRYKITIKGYNDKNKANQKILWLINNNIFLLELFLCV